LLSAKLKKLNASNNDMDFVYSFFNFLSLFIFRNFHTDSFIKSCVIKKCFHHAPKKNDSLPPSRDKKKNLKIK